MNIIVGDLRRVAAKIELLSSIGTQVWAGDIIDAELLARTRIVTALLLSCIEEEMRAMRRRDDADLMGRIGRLIKAGMRSPHDLTEDAEWLTRLANKLDTRAA
jgi:hypothetical protein